MVLTPKSFSFLTILQKSKPISQSTKPIPYLHFCTYLNAILLPFFPVSVFTTDMTDEQVDMNFNLVGAI